MPIADILQISLAAALDRLSSWEYANKEIYNLESLQRKLN